MSIHPLPSSRDTDALLQAKIHLAAAHRLAVLHELEEGIDNHFTVTVPGRDDRYLILPFGFHWSEARASDMHSIRAAWSRSAPRSSSSTRRSTAETTRSSGP